MVESWIGTPLPDAVLAATGCRDSIFFSNAAICSWTAGVCLTTKLKLVVKQSIDPSPPLWSQLSGAIDDVIRLMSVSKSARDEGASGVGRTRLATG